MEKEIESIFEGLLNSASYMHIKRYEDFKNKTFEDFTSALLMQNDLSVEAYFSLITNPLESFQKGFIASHIKDSRPLYWMLINYKFIENNFKQIIKDKEGLVCSGDKSSYIVKSIALFLIDGTKIMQQPKSEKDYFRTTEVFNTHDWVMEFFNALHNLYLGNYGVYLKELKSTLSKSNLLIKNRSESEKEK
jgi:hypothetical protein